MLDQEIGFSFMTLLKLIFWNAAQHRLRSFWRLVLFLLLVSLIANPLILLLDATDIQVLEASFENVLAALGFGFALIISARFFDKRPLKDYGLQISKEWCAELGFGFLIGAGVISVAFAGMYLAGWISIEGTFKTSFATTPFFFVLLGQFLRYFSGSFFEELFSRSYLLRMIAENLRGSGMSRTRSVLYSTAATSLLFGLLHLFNPGASILSLVNLTLLGLLFAIPMLITGRLGYSIGIHMGWNIFQNNIFGFPNGGKLSHATVLATQAHGPEAWTGGAFGPEGGFAVFVVLTVVLVCLIGWLRRRGKKLSLQLSLADPPQA